MKEEVHHIEPTPNRRVWSSYELAFVALVLFALVGIAAGFAFELMGVPMANPPQAEGAESVAESTQVELADGIEQLALLPSAISEGSGLVVSRSHEGLLWIHNDDPGAPRLFGMDMEGIVQTVVTVPGIQVTDFEDIGIGACPAVGAAASGTCLYLADIGDNNYNRPSYTVFAVAEPAPDGAEGQATVVGQAAYTYERGGSRDAEALAVAPDGRVLIVTKGQDGRADLFAIEAAEFSAVEAVPASPTVARYVATLAIDVSQQESRVTAAAISPDGTLFAVRTGSNVYIFPFNQWDAAPEECPLGSSEPQGEAIAFLDNTHLLLAGETGSSRPAPLLRLTCP